MLRQAGHGDAEQIAALVNLAYRPGPAQRGWTHEAELVSGARVSVAQVGALIAGGGAVLVTCDGQVVVGCVHIEPAGDICGIGMLATHPAWQDRGLGRALLAAAEALAVSRFAATGFSLSVLSARPELLAYYERRGYRPTGARSPYPVDAGVGSPRVRGLEVIELLKPGAAQVSAASGLSAE